MSKAKEEQIEQAPILDDEDEAILDKIWDDLADEEESE